MGTLVLESLQSCNSFNKFFKAKIEKLVQRIDKTKVTDPLEKIRTKVKDMNLNFTLQPVDVKEVLKVLQNLKPKTSCGLDGISSEVIKMCKEEMAGPLTIIVNRSICSGVFPADYKVAKVCPILKKGDPLQTKNYRPVALLSAAGMVLEKIVADQVESHFESEGLLGNFQFGFRKNKSTVSEMLTLFEKLQESKEGNQQTLVVLYDLSAAFDTVEPKVLLEKLTLYGFDARSRQWMESYLNGRSQVTTVGGSTSEPVTLNLGTPQGSRLSPLLFIILMADLDLWTTESFLSNFADDTQSSFSKPTVEELKSAAKEESAAVVNHFGANNLVNNADKAALLYNNRGKAGNITMEIAGEQITSVESEKLLGLHFSSSMDWKTHIQKLLSTLNQRLGVLRRLRPKVPGDKLRIIAEAIFTSVARYGIAVYSKPRLHKDAGWEDLHKLQVVQNKMLRLLAGKKTTDKVRVESLAKQFSVMSMNQMTCYHVLMETYKIVHFGASEKLREKLVPKNIMSRSLSVPLFKKTTCRGFTFFAARLWNALPMSIRDREKPHQSKVVDVKRLGQFKREIKNWILDGGVPFK